MPKQIGSHAFIQLLSELPASEVAKLDPNAIVVSDYKGFCTITFGREFQAAISPELGRKLVKELRKAIAHAEKGKLRLKSERDARALKAQQQARADRARILKEMEEKNV